MVEHNVQHNNTDRAVCILKAMADIYIVNETLGSLVRPRCSLKIFATSDWVTTSLVKIIRVHHLNKTVLF